jgi:hypothetical protein
MWWCVVESEGKANCKRQATVCDERQLHRSPSTTQIEGHAGREGGSELTCRMMTEEEHMLDDGRWRMDES